MTLAALAIAAAIVWLGRKRLAFAILIAAGFLLLAAVMIPSMAGAKAAADRTNCIANLKRIHGVKGEWAEINHKAAGDTPTVAELCATNILNCILGEFPTCPRGGTYAIGAMRQNPTCTFAHKGHRLD